MKFRSERDALQEALATASRAAATRGGALPVLSGVRMEASDSSLQVTGSDLDLTIQVETEVSVDDEGVCVVPARLITDIVRALEPGAVVFEVDEGEARISSGRSQFAVRVLPAEELAGWAEVAELPRQMTAPELIAANLQGRELILDPILASNSIAREREIANCENSRTAVIRSLMASAD